MEDVDMSEMSLVDVWDISKGEAESPPSSKTENPEAETQGEVELSDDENVLSRDKLEDRWLKE